MKSVGIITMHGVRNYGSFMQAYATQQSIEKLGYRAEIIDYCYPNELHGFRKPSFQSRILHAASSLVKSLLPGNPYRTLNRRWNNACARYYHLSRPYASRSSLIENPPIYDIYLVGSDQVWNERFIRKDNTFFAAFAPPSARKVAFGSSFGCLEVSDRAFYKSNLMSLQSIAIRESSGVRLAESITGRTDIQHVLDPSFLLSAQEWRDISTDVPKRKRNYIFIYGSNAEDYILSTAKALARENDLDILRCNGSALDYFRKDVHYVLDAGPLEWLSLIDGAALVIACSFHGIAFSIQFNRPFIGIRLGNEQYDSRMDGLLAQFGLSDSSLTVGDKMVLDFDKISRIDWGEINHILEEQRQSSLHVLKDMLQWD